jgi:hypothetical protein
VIPIADAARNVSKRSVASDGQRDHPPPGGTHLDYWQTETFPSTDKDYSETVFV